MVSAAAAGFLYQESDAGLDAAGPGAESGGHVNNAKFIIQVSKGIIRDARVRRLVMFYSVLVALVLLFAGSTLLWGFLRARPLLFVGYWFVCAWITVLSALLAIYDLVKVRADGRRARRSLESQILPPEDHENTR